MRGDCMPTKESSGCSLDLPYWQREGHILQRCDASTGHTVRNVALCDSEETAETILRAIRAFD